MPTDVREAVNAFATWVRERFGPRVYRLTLFGSFARGEGILPDSDVDVLATIDDLDREELFEVVQRGAEVSATYALAFTPLPVTGDEYRKLERQQRLLAVEIARDGVPL